MPDVALGFDLTRFYDRGAKPDYCDFLILTSTHSRPEVQNVRPAQRRAHIFDRCRRRIVFNPDQGRILLRSAVQVDSVIIPAANKHGLRIVHQKRQIALRRFQHEARQRC